MPDNPIDRPKSRSLKPLRALWPYLRHYKKTFEHLRVAVVGDILHSRVARSQIHALTTLGEL
jgi:hypothetical protein